jgi:heterodisulfide reductase subunit C
MAKQIIFTIVLLITVGIFLYSVKRYVGFFRLTKPAFPVKDLGKRFRVMLKVAFGQTKILRRPVIGLFHAIVFWGFCVILFGSVEMIIDGLTGSEKVLHRFGVVYDIFVASGDIFGFLVAISIVIFLSRRIFFHIKRFYGVEMKHVSHQDANFALFLILVLMVSLTGMNAVYYQCNSISNTQMYGVFPVGSFISLIFAGLPMWWLKILYQIFWWTHILLIFLFANILPYSKHFHVFMSIPNVFLSRLGPLGKMTNMDNVMKEVQGMLDPNSAPATPETALPVERFGIKDIEDVTWKNYLDSLACTECGRCTSVCPANITGKRLSPRKIVMDVRARMKEKGPSLIRSGNQFNDNKSLLRDYIQEEELWACTSCNACVQECPININQLGIILDMRRYLVMEEGSAPAPLKSMLSYIENNGAPWQYSADDRLLWAKDLEMNVTES